MELSEKNIIKIWDEKNNFSVLPERWAIVTSVVLDWTEILFQEMLPQTLFDLTKNVRGWIPILFPFAWPIQKEDSEKLWYFLPQHWIARIYSWEVFQKWVNFIVLRFDEKKQIWEYKIPQKFEVFLFYEILENFFKISMKIINNDEKDFKISHWFHPYFKVPNSVKNDILWEENYNEVIKNNSEIWQRDWTLSLKFPENWFSFKIPKVWKITLKSSKDLEKIWIWSIQENKNFVCVEPVVWDDWNILKKPIIIKSWEVFESFFEIKFEK